LGTLQKKGPEVGLSYYVLTLTLYGSVVTATLIFLRKVVDPWRLRRSVAKQFATSPSLRETKDIEVSDYGIEGTSFLGSGSTKWAALIGVIETDSDFHFLTAPRSSIFIPKSAFADEDDIRRLRVLVEDKLGSLAQLNY
jgi:hypothetical protein